MGVTFIVDDEVLDVFLIHSTLGLAESGDLVTWHDITSLCEGMIPHSRATLTAVNILSPKTNEDGSLEKSSLLTQISCNSY